MKKTEEKVIKFIESSSLIKKHDKVLVAFSGGPDSVFLLHFLKKFQNKYRIEIGAFHLNHMLREKSADLDEKFCKQYCEKLNLRYFSYRKDVQKFAKKEKISIEEAGRVIRYNYLNELLNKYQFSKIATAHIQDDNTETIFLNLIKGSGITGMAGISSKRDNLIRPLLCLSKGEIFDYLNSYKIKYRIDESNFSDDYERNYLRQQVIPLIKKKLNPSIDETVFNSSLVFQSVKDFFDNNILEFRNQAIKTDKKSITLNIKLISEFHKSIVTESIRENVRTKWKVSLNYNDVKRLLELIEKQSGLSIELSEKIVALKDRNNLIISRKSSIINLNSHNINVGKEIKTKLGTISIKTLDKKKIRYTKNSDIEYISGDNLSNNFVIRKWKPGDKFYPLGMMGEKKVSDFLIDIKMNRFDKQKQLVLAQKDNIIWLIGKRIDNRVKITNETKKVLKICWKQKKK